MTSSPTSSWSRAGAMVVVFALVVGGAAWLVSSGVDFTSKQKRAAELADLILTHQNRMKSLYDQRSSLISTWLDEYAAIKPVTDAKDEAKDEAAAAEARSSGAEPPAPSVDAVRSQAELNAVRAALEESRSLTLQNQAQFDQFDRLQNQISNYVSQNMLERLRQDANSGHGPISQDQIRGFERLEMDIANTRRDYHAAAFERNQLLGELNDLPFGLTPPAALAPVFSAERVLHEQTAGR